MQLLGVRFIGENINVVLPKPYNRRSIQKLRGAQLTVEVSLCIKALREAVCADESIFAMVMSSSTLLHPHVGPSLQTQDQALFKPTQP